MIVFLFYCFLFLVLFCWFVIVVCDCVFVLLCCLFLILLCWFVSVLIVFLLFYCFVGFCCFFFVSCWFVIVFIVFLSCFVSFCVMLEDS